MKIYTKKTELKYIKEVQKLSEKRATITKGGLVLENTPIILFG